MDATAFFPQLTADEAAYLEACLVRRRELLALARQAPDGQVLSQCEDAAVELVQASGRELIGAALAEKVADVEKKKGRPGRVRAVGSGTTAVPIRERS
jgi:hypothetical protein